MAFSREPPVVRRKRDSSVPEALKTVPLTAWNESTSPSNKQLSNYYKLLSFHLLSCFDIDVQEVSCYAKTISTHIVNHLIIAGRSLVINMKCRIFFFPSVPPLR